MSEPHRAPHKIRVARPYDSEEAFVQGDAGRIGRVTIILPGVDPHPNGDTVRFEIALTNGSIVFRGEGLVVAHHGPGGIKPPGLEVRITRFDARSKAVLDRVHAWRLAHSRGAAMGVARASVHPPPSPSAAPTAPSGPPPSSLAPPRAGTATRSDRAGPPSFAPHAGTGSIAPHAGPSDLGSMSLIPVRRPSDGPRTGVQTRVSLAAPVRRISPPARRDEILEQLRVRAKTVRESGGPAYKTPKR